MKRKLSAIVLACMMACLSFGGLIGCGGGNKVTEFVMPKNGFDISKPVEIKFYHTMGQTLAKVLNTYIENFNKLYPNIKVVQTKYNDYPDVRDQISNEINAGRQPNLAYCYPDHVAMFNQSKAVLPLNGFLPDGEYKNVIVKHADGTTEPIGFTQAQKDAFIQSYYEEGFKFGDGKTMYTLPFLKSTEVLYYNADYFKTHNLDVPTTWDEMEDVCKKIKEGDGTTPAISPNSTPFGYDSEANWFITMCEQYESPYTSSTGEKFLFDNAKNRAFVEKFYGWYKKGYFTTRALNGTYTSDLFKEKKSFMCIGSTAGAQYQSPGSTDSNFPFEIGIAPIPQVNPDKPKVISQGPSVCIFKNEDPQKVLASWLLAKYLTTSIGFQANFSAVSGYVPVITTVMENETYRDNIEHANGYENATYLAAKVCMEQEKAYYTSPAFVGSSTARDQVGALMQAVFSDSKTIDKAFKDAVEECKYMGVD